MAFIQIEKNIKKPIVWQIYHEIRALILKGLLSPNYKLPSSRELSEELHISRITVVTAYEQLIAEGFLNTKKGSGTFVSEGATYNAKDNIKDLNIKNIGFQPHRLDKIDFRSGLPNLNMFPMSKWLSITRKVYSEISPLALAYGQPEGRIELRSAIANYIRIFRGVNCSQENIIITAGTTQAIGIISKLLITKDKSNIVLEDPITSDICQIIKGYNGNIIPVPVDHEGLDTSKLNSNMSPQFIYVTPSHQFPLGSTMPIQRRIDLLDYAKRNNSYIIEDDYDSEFSYNSPPVSSIQGIDPDQVIYIGTFSKTLFPALRIAYIVFPNKLINWGRQVKWFADLHNTVLDQLVLSQFIELGYYHKHIQKMKKNQKLKREVLKSQLINSFSNSIKILGNDIGLHLCVKFKNHKFIKKDFEEIEKKGVILYPVEKHTIIKGKYNDTIIMGYGMLDTDKIIKGVEILKNYLDFK